MDWASSIIWINLSPAAGVLQRHLGGLWPQNLERWALNTPLFTFENMGVGTSALTLFLGSSLLLVLMLSYIKTGEWIPDKNKSVALWNREVLNTIINIYFDKNMPLCEEESYFVWVLLPDCPAGHYQGLSSAKFLIISLGGLHQSSRGFKMEYSSPQMGFGSSLLPPSFMSPHSNLQWSGSLAEQLIPPATLISQSGEWLVQLIPLLCIYPTNSFPLWCWDALGLNIFVDYRSTV